MFIIHTYVCIIIYISGWPQIHYVTKDDFELLILLSYLLLSSAGVGVYAIMSGLCNIGNQTQGLMLGQFSTNYAIFQSPNLCVLLHSFELCKFVNKLFQGKKTFKVDFQCLVSVVSPTTTPNFMTRGIISTGVYSEINLGSLESPK